MRDCTTRKIWRLLYSSHLSHYAADSCLYFFLHIMTDEEKKAKKREYDKIYRALNKEKIAARKHKYYEEHKSEKRQYDLKYRTKTVEKRKKYKAEWNKEKKSEMSVYNKKYYGTIDGLAKRRRNHYLSEDKRRDFNIDLTVTAEWIKEHILQNNKCVYCGDSEFSHLGCDRIDNEKGHTPDNVVCSCAICNWERELEKMSVEEFIEYRKTHPRFKEEMPDNIDRKSGEKKPLKKKDLSKLLY